MESEKSLLLQVDHLIHIKYNDKLNVRYEEQVFNVGMSCLKFNVTDHRQFQTHVPQHVQMALLSPKLCRVMSPNSRYIEMALSNEVRSEQLDEQLTAFYI